jgi:hypothetical protein
MTVRYRRPLAGDLRENGSNNDERLHVKPLASSHFRW